MPPTTTAGLNRAQWNFQYPGATVFDGMIIWSGRPQTGPTAPPGHYQVRLTAGGETQTQGFDVVRNPNLKGVTDDNLQEQFALAIQIRDRTSAANEAVIQIRDVRGQVEERLAMNASLDSDAEPLLTEIAAIELDLYQVKNQSGQDPLNFPIKLNNRLASLRRSVQTGEAQPTDGAYRVFEELSSELHVHLERLRVVFQTTLVAFNVACRSLNLEAVTIDPDQR